MIEHIQVSARLRQAISVPYGSSDDLMSQFLQPAPSALLTEEDYAHVGRDLGYLTRALAGALRERRVGVNILIYGAPGTGKTELAKLLAKRVSAQLFEVTRA